MPFAHKGKLINEKPAAGCVEQICPGRAHFNFGVTQGEALYLFNENSKQGIKDGGLLARGTITSAEPYEKSWLLTVEFDGCRVRLPLLTHQLDGFRRSSSEDNGPFRSPIMTELSEIWRNTTHQPIHHISADTAAWLDIYHFEN